MGFQYDSDDLGYECGYEKPFSITSKTTQALIGETNSQIVTYECIATPCPTGQIHIYNPNGTMVKDADGKDLCVDPNNPSGSAKADKKEDDKKANENDKRAESKSVQEPLPKAEPTGVRTPKGETQKDLGLSRTGAAFPTAANTAKERAEAAKQDALKGSTFNEINGLGTSSANKLRIELNKKMPEGEKTWQVELVTREGKKSVRVFHPKTNVEILYNAGGDPASPSPTVWKLSGSSHSTKHTNQFVPVTIAAAKAKLEGVKDKDRAKGILENDGWTVKKVDVSKKDGTIIIKAIPKGGKEPYTFELKDGKVAKVHGPAGHHQTHDAKSQKLPEELALEGDLRREGALQSTIDQYEQETFPSGHKERLTHVTKQKSEFKNYLANPENRGKGEFYLTARLSFHYIKKIEEKLGTEGTEKTLLARGFIIERTPTGARKVMSRELPDGTIRPLNGSDLSELASLKQQVHEEGFKPEDLKQDTDRRVAINDYLRQVSPRMRDSTRDLLARMDYIGSDGNPTKFDVRSFRTAMFSGSSAGQVPTLKALSPFTTAFREYQNESQRLENEKDEIKKWNPEDHTEAEIDEEYAVKQAELKDKFDMKMKATLASADPSTRAYVQEQLKVAGYYSENDPNKKPKADWNSEKFVETIAAATAAPFNSAVQDYQKATDANEKARQAALARYKPTDTAHITEVNEIYNKKAEGLKKDLDKKIAALNDSADPVTIKYITKKLQSVGYYKNDKFEVDPNWSKEKQDQFIKETSALAVSTTGVAKLPQQAMVDDLTRLRDRMTASLTDHKDDPEQLHEDVDKYKKRVDGFLKGIDKITDASARQKITTDLVGQSRTILTEVHHFSPAEADAIIYSWGFTDHPGGKVLPKVGPDEVMGRIYKLTGANAGDILPSHDAIKREALHFYREEIPKVLGGETQINGETVAKTMLKRGYFGKVANVQDHVLGDMAKDLDQAKSGDPTAIAQLTKEYQSDAAKVKALPSVGTPEGNQAAIAQAAVEGAVQADDKNATAGATANGGKADSAEEGATPSAKGGKGRVAKGRKEERGNDHGDIRSKVERENIKFREKELAFNQKDRKLTRLQEAEKLELEREKIEIDQETKAADRVFTDRQEKRRIQVQLVQTMIQFFGQLIQAAMGALQGAMTRDGQMIATGFQVYTAGGGGIRR